MYPPLAKGFHLPHQYVDLSRTANCKFVAEFCEDSNGFFILEGLWYGPAGFCKYYSFRDSEEPAGLMFCCPGCFEVNSIAFKPFDQHPVWQWDGNRDAPSCEPSIYSDPAKGGCGWHGFLKKGVFQLER